ncbi:MAG: hypothetical protein ACYSVY_01100 [Planctomycetota bacterium]|jgi:hypothetical protein
MAWVKMPTHLIALVSILLLLLACGGDPEGRTISPRGRCADCFPAAMIERSERGLGLHALALADTYAPEGPVQVAVMVYNATSSPRDIGRLIPAFVLGGSPLSATITEANGDTLATMVHISVLLSAYDEVTLRGGDFVSGIIDLSCVIVTPDGRCAAAADLHEPGVYTITFQFRLFCDSVMCGPNQPVGHRLVSPPVDLRIAQGQP